MDGWNTGDVIKTKIIIYNFVVIFLNAKSLWTMLLGKIIKTQFYRISEIPLTLPFHNISVSVHGEVLQVFEELMMAL